MDDRPPLLLTIDFEDWHQLVHRRVGRADWDRPHRELEEQMDSLLDLLDELGARATFFLLGMTVATSPELVREIVERGHEPASHGYAHRLVHEQDPETFRDDVARSVETIEAVTGHRPTAYRAPAFSITRRTPWAYEILADLGFRCDSSQYDSPRVRDRIGGIPVGPYRLRLQGGAEIWELPVAVRGRLPLGGGSYWRLLPAGVLHRALRPLDVLYFHPYEFSPVPLRAVLGASATPRQRAIAGSRSLWRNAARGSLPRRLRSIARRYRLVSYDQVHDDITRRYGTRTRALSQEGVLV
jgi:polysaccharide deacetylase family protein (PEP-CTERM system associated)